MDDQWIPVIGFACALVGVLVTSFVRDRNNPMSQVVKSAVENTTSIARQLTHLELLVRHQRRHISLLRDQLRGLDVEPVDEPPFVS